MVVFLCLLVGTALRWSASPYIYYERCSGRSAAFCDLIKSFQGYEILGLNPALLAFAIFMGIFLIYCARRLWAGWSAKLVGDQISVPRLLGTNRVNMSDLVAVEVRPKLFGLVAHLNLTMKDGRRLSAANANFDDCKKFARSVKTRISAWPANPPAA